MEMDLRGVKREECDLDTLQACMKFSRSLKNVF